MTNRYNKKVKRPRQTIEEQAKREAMETAEEEGRREAMKMIEEQGLVSAFFTALEEDEEEIISEAFARDEMKRKSRLA